MKISRKKNHKTASGFRSEGLEKRQLLPAVKETRFGAKWNILEGKEARNLCWCCSSLNNPAKRGVCTVTALWQAGEGSKGKHNYPTGCVDSKIVPGDPGERKRGEK